MIKTWTQQPNTQNLLVDFVAQLENSLKQSLTMSLHGTKMKIASSLLSLVTNLSILAKKGAQNVAKVGLAYEKKVNWATHKSDWRGNWSPEVARNLILRYSKEGDVLLDPMIDFAIKQYPKYRFEVSNAEKLSFKNSKFDLVTNSISFHHYQNPEKSLNEAYRVLKSGGQFLLMDITPKHKSARKINDFAARYIIRDGHEAFHSLNSVKSMFKKAGFQNVEQHFVGFPGVHITLGVKSK